MALYPPRKDLEKLIFAPSPSPGPGPTGQFVKHEPLGGLRRSDLHPSDPIAQFHSWFQTASGTLSPATTATSHAAAPLSPAITIAHPETCTLSTASLPSGRVSARVVYLKELDGRGFVVYSNVGTSRKGRDLFGDATSTGGGAVPNPWAALTFWWEPLERQVRVEGRVERLPPQESQAYFDLRVRGSRVGAWASRQSAVLEPTAAGGDDDDGRAKLDGWVREAETRFDGVEKIPCPDFWGGLRVVPERVEFWQGRENRLHDRFVYDRVPGGEGQEDTWTLQRLSP